LLVIAAARRVRAPRTRDLGWIIACGFFGMTAYQLLLNQSELHVPAGTASIIVSAAPLVSVAVARVLFEEKITPFTMVGSAVALGGVAIVCLARAGVSLSASVWVVIAAMVVQGIYHPLQRPLLRKYNGLEVATYTMVAGTIMTLPFVPYGWAELLESSTAGWIAAIYLGLLPSALGFVLWGYVTATYPSPRRRHCFTSCHRSPYSLPGCGLAKSRLLPNFPVVSSSSPELWSSPRAAISWPTSPASLRLRTVCDV
jgi:drug/metabolite transporter (DMT)-like permease